MKLANERYKQLPRRYRDDDYKPEGIVLIGAIAVIVWFIGLIVWWFIA